MEWTQLQDVKAPPLDNANWSSETIILHSLQDFARLKDRLHGRLDKHICTLDASAHLEDVNEAVVQDVVDVVGQTLNGRAAHFFDALSTSRSLQAHDATTEPKSRNGLPYLPCDTIATQQRRIVTLGDTPLLRLTPRSRRRHDILNCVRLGDSANQPPRTAGGSPLR